MESIKKTSNPSWVLKSLLPEASQFAIDSCWTKKQLARWLSCWLNGAVSPDLLRWLCLNDQNRIQAEKALAEYIKKQACHTTCSRHILRDTKISRNTCWAKTMERSCGHYPVSYYNSVRKNVPDRFLYGALHWLVRRWGNEIRQYRGQIFDFETRSNRLDNLLRLPVLADSVPVPFQARHLIRLYDLRAMNLVECLQDLQRQENTPYSMDDEKTLRSIFEKYTQEVQIPTQNINYNNLLELLVLLKSARTLLSLSIDWKLVKTEVTDPQSSNAPPKPAIYLENDCFCCQIRKGNIQNLDHLSKVYRGKSTSGFEPDTVFLFSKKSESKKKGNAVIFLGDAKNYKVSNHDIAVRDKLLNVFAFAKALGIRVLSDDSDSMIRFHKLSDNTPVPSFLIFFPPVDEEGMSNKGERSYRNVIEKFSLSCFDCAGEKKVAEHVFCDDCPGNLKQSLKNIITLISGDSFQWPLHLDRNSNRLTEIPQK